MSGTHDSVRPFLEIIWLCLSWSGHDAQGDGMKGIWQSCAGLTSLSINAATTKKTSIESKEVKHRRGCIRSRAQPTLAWVLLALAPVRVSLFQPYSTCICHKIVRRYIVYSSPRTGYTTNRVPGHGFQSGRPQSTKTPATKWKELPEMAASAVPAYHPPPRQRPASARNHLDPLIF